MDGKFCLISSLSRSTTFPQYSMNPNNKKHVSTQTSSEVSYNQENISLNQENKLTYDLAINFINKYHQLMNTLLDETLETQTDCEVGNMKFKFPEIPNYASLFFVITRLINPEENTLIQETKKSYSLIDILPELKLPYNLLTRNFSSELNVLDYKTQFTKLLQNRSVNSVVRNISPKYEISSKSEKFETHSHPVEADNNLEAKTEIFNISSKNKTVNVDTQVSQKEIKLVKSCFNIVNINPCTNLISYSKTKENVNKMKTYIFNKEKGKPTGPSFNVRPTTLKKVKNMFDEISKEGNKTKTVVRDESSDANSKCEETSDTDSVILDDEQFEQMYQHSKGKQTESREEKHEKMNPFHLNSKDLSHVNGETLSAIGLFTDRGEIRPDIINILKTKKNQKSNDSRNKQFRTKRQWDFQVHLNPRNDFVDNDNVPSVSSDVLTYSSDIKLQINNVKSQYTVP